MRSDTVRFYKFKYCGFLMFAAFCSTYCVHAQNLSQDFQGRVLPQGHNGAINAVVYDGRSVLSAGEDGFLEWWDIEIGTASGAARERFQISRLPLKALCLRPGNDQLAVVESDNQRQHRVSVWDYATKQRLFSVDFQTAPAFIAYSASGGFLIVSKSDRSGVVCFDSETGALTSTIQSSAGAVIFAATGKSERTMIAYTDSGTLFYWDIGAAREIQRVSAPVDIQNPVLFGNNRFFAAIVTGRRAAEQGLMVLDAVSGKQLDRDPRITRGAVFPIGDELAEFICLSEGAVSMLYHFSVSSKGKLEIKNSALLSPVSPVLTAAAVQDTAVLGMADGNMLIISPNGTTSLMAVKGHRRIGEIAASNGFIGFLAGGQFSRLPLDYTALTVQNGPSAFEETAYTHLASATGGFILWQGDSIQPAPVFQPVNGDTLVLKPHMNFPLRTAVTLGDRALFVDSVGNIRIVSLTNGELIFTFSSSGSLDAAFLDEKNIIIGRGDISGTAPFLKVNIVTGETVPIAYPAPVGVRVYRGASGGVYGAVIDQSSGTQKTALIALDLAKPARSELLAAVAGEDFTFALAEAASILAANPGGGTALRYGAGSAVTTTALEQSAGFPVQLIDGGMYFLSVDTDGLLAWNDPESGRLLARFYLYEDGWALEENGGRIANGNKR
jgi:hypothetical protein